MRHEGREVLMTVREKLNKEIRVALIMTAMCPDSDFFKGRLNGLLWVRDHLLYNRKEID